MAQEQPEPKVGKVMIEKGEVSPEQQQEIETGEYFSLQQLATRLCYGRAWIRQLVQEGRIKAIKPLGGRWRIPKSEYERIIKEGIPPLPREPTEKPPVTEIVVEDKKLMDKVREPEKKKEEPLIRHPLDFSGLFGG